MRWCAGRSSLITPSARSDLDDDDGDDDRDGDDDGDQERVQVGGGGGGWREEVESQTGFSRSAACPPPLAGQPGEP